MLGSAWGKLRFTYGRGMRPEEPGLYGIDWQSPDADDFVGYEFYRWSIRPALNHPSTRILTDNKWIFYQLGQGLGLPVAETYALFDPVFGVSRCGEPCRTREDLVGLLGHIRPTGLVVKPAGGIQGKGVLIFDSIDYGTNRVCVRGGNTSVMADELDELPPIERRGSPGYVVQELLRQHPLLTELNPHTTNTVRIVTHLNHRGEVWTPFASLRIGRRGMVTDSWGQGGVAVGIDIRTGRLTRGRLHPKHGGEQLGVHPDTGVPLEGRRLPWWNEALAVCRRAARVLPGVRSIGWDVVIAPDGPRLLEANEEWSLVMSQGQGGGWLAVPGIREDLEHYGIHCGSERGWKPSIVRYVASRQLSRGGRRIRQRISELRGSTGDRGGVPKQ
jgi:hypothetical protein